MDYSGLFAFEKQIDEQAVRLGAKFASSWKSTGNFSLLAILAIIELFGAPNRHSQRAALLTIGYQTTVSS